MNRYLFYIVMLGISFNMHCMELLAPYAQPLSQRLSPKQYLTNEDTQKAIELALKHCEQGFDPKNQEHLNAMNKIFKRANILLDFSLQCMKKKSSEDLAHIISREIENPELKLKELFPPVFSICSRLLMLHMNRIESANLVRRNLTNPTSSQAANSLSNIENQQTNIILTPIPQEANWQESFAHYFTKITNPQTYLTEDKSKTIARCCNERDEHSIELDPNNMDHSRLVAMAFSRAQCLNSRIMKFLIEDKRQELENLKKVHTSYFSPLALQIIDSYLKTKDAQAANNLRRIQLNSPLSHSLPNMPALATEALNETHSSFSQDLLQQASFQTLAAHAAEAALIPSADSAPASLASSSSAPSSSSDKSQPAAAPSATPSQGKKKR